MLDLDKLAEEWPSSFVARSEIENFTKGMYKSGSLRTLDSAKLGVKRKIILGTKIAYLKADVVEWIRERKRKKS